MASRKPRHGGTRPGAGRKPTGATPRVSVTLYLEAEQRDLVDATAAREGVTRSTWVREAVMTAVARGSSR